MRHIGYVSNQQHADRFVDYLLSIGVQSQIEEEDGQWAVWIRDEDQVPISRASLDEFQDNPDADKYLAAIAEASKRRAEERRRRAEASKNTFDVRRHVWKQPATRRMPVTVSVLLLCVAIGILTQLGAVGREAALQERSVGASVYGLLTFRAPTTGGDAWASIRDGQVWRLLTPAFLHLSLMHIVFNMVCLFSLGGQIEARRSWWLLILLLVIAAIAGNVAQAALQGPYFGGLSGAVYGFFGYMLVRQKKAPQEGLSVSNQTVFIFMLVLVLGFTNVLGGIANYAHLFGMVAGMIMATIMPE